MKRCILCFLPLQLTQYLLNKRHFIWRKEEVKEDVPIAKRRIVYQIKLINNRTEKEYIINSENDFGLDWQTIDGWLHIKQNTTSENWFALAALTEFSVIKCEWKEVNI